MELLFCRSKNWSIRSWIWLGSSYALVLEYDSDGSDWLRQPHEQFRLQREYKLMRRDFNRPDLDWPQHNVVTTSVSVQFRPDYLLGHRSFGCGNARFTATEVQGFTPSKQNPIQSW